MKIPRTVGAPQSLAHPSALIRDLRPMVAFVRSQKIETAADARAIKARLRSAYPDARILAAVRARGRAAEAAASRPWGTLDRLARSVGLIDAARKTRRKAPYDGVQLVDTWSRRAAGLIRSVREEVSEGLRLDVVAALEAGTPPEALASQWVRQGIPIKFGTLEGRAKTIARHQLTTLHAQVQSARARALGVTDFMWRTQGDDNVRDLHTELADTRHAYASPPSEGLPGEPVNCRCWAESVISDDLAGRLGVSFLPGVR